MVLGLDISTSCIGYSLFSMDSELLKIGSVSMNSDDNYFVRLDQFLKHIDDIVKMGTVQHISIEEPLVKFKGKFSSAGTIAKLNFFNGMVSAACYKAFGVVPIYFNVNNIRKTVWPNHKFTQSEGTAKQQVWELVKNMEPHINWKYGPRSRKLLDENFDMADSYAAGTCLLVTLEKQKKII